MTVRKLFFDINKLFFRLSCLFIAGLLFFSTPVSASVSTEAYTKDAGSGYSLLLDDGADFFTPEQEKLLTAQMEEITEFCNVAVVTTTNSSGYSSTENYTVAYYENWFGNGSNGVIFVIDFDKREIYLVSEGSARKTISNSRAYTITDNTYTYATDGDYYSCASKTLEQVNILMQGGRIAQPMRYVCSALLALILALLINYFIVMFQSRSRKADVNKILEGTYTSVKLSNASAVFRNQTRTYSPQDSGGSSGGGGGGGGGGGHSGGGHSF